MHARPLLIPMILCALALNGCAPKRIEALKPPADLLACADEPVAPSLPGRDEQARRDALTLDYVLAMRSAWGSCHAAVAGVRAWVDRLND